MDPNIWYPIGLIAGAAASAATIITAIYKFATYLYRLWRRFENLQITNEKFAEVNSNLERINRDLTRERDALKSDCAAAKSDSAQKVTKANNSIRQANASIQSLRERLAKATGDNAEVQKRDVVIADLKSELVAVKAQIEKHQATELELTRDLEDSRNSVLELDAIKSTLSAQLEAANKRVSDLSTFDGAIWDRPLPKDGPKFRPLSSRSMPIISVLNFKGGVGKTSITANLAAFLGRTEKTVLMVDLDYQRSLSQLVLDDHTRALLQAKGHVLQHFLAGASHDTETFLEMVHNADERMRCCSIMTNSHAFNVKKRTDSLEETENFLMAEWIIKHESISDVRLHLREALHGTGIESHFDFVFLDCPPRITTSTINALAASDYVLVPVVPDHVSATSVLPLIASVRKLQAIFPQLKILGVVANQVKFHGGKLIQREKIVWENLKMECTRAFSDIRVPFFDAVVPLHSAFGSSPTKDRNYLAIEDADIYDIFQKLSKEIQKEIASHACSKPAAVLV